MLYFAPTIGIGEVAKCLENAIFVHVSRRHVLVRRELLVARQSL